MKILVIDSTTAGQAQYANLIYSLDPQTLDTFQIELKLETPDTYSSNLDDCHLVILGSGLGDVATGIANQVRAIAAGIPLLLFVTPSEYSAGSFQLAYSSGIRRVLPDDCNSSDLLQELVALHAGLCRDGKMHDAKMVVVTSATGGAGVTSFVAALGEVCDIYGKRTLLWDLDVETQDLTRALCAFDGDSKAVSNWVQDLSQLNRNSFEKALCPIAPNTKVLVPPEGMASSLDLVCHLDGVQIVDAIFTIARKMFDVIIVDAGGLTGPAVANLMRISERNIVMVGDSTLSVSALDAYLRYGERLFQQTRKLSFLATHRQFSSKFLRTELDPSNTFGLDAWDLPLVEYDKAAANWAGQGKTLYTLGGQQIRFALEQIAKKLGFINIQSRTEQEDASLNNRFASAPQYTDQNRGMFGQIKRFAQLPTLLLPYRHRTVSVKADDFDDVSLDHLTYAGNKGLHLPAPDGESDSEKLPNNVRTLRNQSLSRLEKIGVNGNGSRNGSKNGSTPPIAENG